MERHGVILNPGMLLTVTLGEKVAGQSGSNNYHELTSDDEGTVYAAPHWKADTKEKVQNYPVAYKRGSKMRVSAEFQFPPTVEQAKVRAWGTDGVNIPETALVLKGGGLAKLDWVETGNALPDAIKHYDGKDAAKRFKPRWEIQRNGGAWEEVFRKTSHTVYVTKDTPATDRRQETLFWLACRKADGLAGTATAQEITNKIWESFPVEYDVQRGGYGVTRVDGKQLYYYHKDLPGSTSTSGLLKGLNGDCEGWSNLFMDVRRVHGLDDVQRYYIASKKEIFAENGPLSR